MNFNKIIVLAVALIVGIMLTINTLTSSGANIAFLAKYLAVGSLFLGFFGKQFPYYLLIIFGATSDLIKRMLIVEGGVGTLDITYILMMSPLLMLGLFTGRVLKCLLEYKISKLEITALAIAVILGVFNFFVAGRTNASVMGVLQAGANVTSYFFLSFCVLKDFRNIQDYLKVVKFAAIVFIPVAIHGVVQAVYGYGGFEYDYLVSGHTTITNFADVDDTRPFSTLSSPGAFAFTSGALGAVCLILARSNKNNLTLANPVHTATWFPYVISVLLGVVLFIGCYVTKSRTQMLVVTCIIPYFFLIKNKTLTIFAYLSVFCSTVFLFLSSGYILENNLIQAYQNNIVPTLKNITGLESRYFLLSTFSVRLEGWHNVVTNPEFWHPFGNAEIAEFRKGATPSELRQAGVISHDMLSNTLISIGWVPLLILGMIGSSVLYRVHQLVSRLDPSTLESKCFRVALLTLFAAYLATLASSAISAYPTSLIVNIIFAMACLSYRDIMYNRDHVAEGHTVDQ